ncbi:MAG: hypothetical protein M0007_02915 [Actinomycetota bacterium]|nr:hypothetical protein [Actinomycetota bacterium]
MFVAWLAGLCLLVVVESRLLVPRRPFPAAFRDVVGSWDAAWLRSIAHFGYQWNGNARTDQNVAFLPLYPLVVRAVHAVSGLSYTTSGFAASVVFQGMFLVVLAVLVAPDEASTGDSPETVPAEGGADRPGASWRSQGTVVVVLAAAYPASVFAIQGYALSLTMLLVTAGLLMIRRGRLTLAALFFGLGTAADPAALAVPVGYALFEWVASGSLLHPIRPRVLARELLGVGGFLASMAYFGIRFHDPLAKLQAGQAWFPHRTLGQVLTALVTFRAVGHGLTSFFVVAGAKPFSYTLDSIVLVALIATIALVWWRGGFGWEVTIPTVGLLPLLLQAAEYGTSYSITRLSYPLWLALVLHRWVRRQLATRPAVVGGILAAQGLVLAVWTVLLVQGRWVN